jgi:PAS domain S-box-containing protein
MGRPLKQVFRTLDEETHETAEMPVAQVVRGGIERQMAQTELVPRGRRSLPIEHCTAPIRGERGAVTGVVIVFRDITEQKRLANELKQRADELERLQRRTAESLALLDTVFESSPVGLAYLDRKLRIRRINPAFAIRNVGTVEDHLGRTIRDLSVECADLLEPHLFRVLATGDPILNQEIGLAIGSTPGSAYSLTSYYPVRARDEVIGVGVAAVDITDRKRAQDALQASEEQYKAVYSQAAVGIAEADLSGHLVRANDRFCEIVGYLPEELRRKTFLDITVETDRPESLRLFQVLIGGGPIYSFEKQFVRKEGTRVWARVAVSLIRDSAGKPARAVAVIEDITERKRLESELRSRVAELAEADRRKDEFLATLAHELRNPLAPIRNALHLMRDSDGDARAIEPERAMAERQVIHLARLIDDLMDIARISRGKIELRTEPLPLAPVVRRAIESVRSAQEGRSQHLAVSLPQEPISVLADPTRLEQILGNLLNNAIKYTEPGGTIQVVVERHEDQSLVRVRDSGIGIEPELLPRVFDLFVQAADHRDRSEGGLGIGLSLVRKLVEMHGGTITAHSAGRGQGSEFVVRLPVLPDHPCSSDDTKREGSILGATTPLRRRILVVDDNIDAAVSLARLLKRLFGQDVRVSHDGPGALESIAQFFPDVVLLDIGMPGMDGYEVATRIRKDPNFSSLKLIALTGWGQETDRLRSREVGFDLHLVKPVDPDALRRILDG